MDNISIKELSDEELIDIMNDDGASYKDIILASVEKGERDYKRGLFYTTEEVKKRILEKSILARKSK